MDSLAAKMGIDPLELRRRNYIPTDQYPYEAFTGLVYDSGDHDQAASKAVELARLRRRPRPPGRAERRGRHQAARHRDVELLRDVRARPVARARLAELLRRRVGGGDGAHPADGQGAGRHRHVTARAGARDVVGDDRRRASLGIDPADIDVLHSDTAIAPLGLDTYGSRSLPVGGRGDRDGLRQGDRQGQADRRPPAGGERRTTSSSSGGVFRVAGSPDKEMPLAAIAFEAFTAHNLPDGLEPNLEAQVTYDPPNFSWPFGTHMCLVEVDVETGHDRRAEVRGGRRLRRAGQPDHRRRPGARRRRAGHGPGAVRRRHLRLRRQPADLDAGRLHGAGGVRRPADHTRPHRHAVADQFARSEGRRRSWHHRRRTHRHERRRRRVVRPGRPRRRDAGQPAQRLGRDPSRPTQHNRTTANGGNP